MIKFFGFYLDFLRNLTVQTTLFAVSVIVAVELNLDISKFDIKNIHGSFQFVGLMVLTVVAAVGNVFVFLSKVSDFDLSEEQNQIIKNTSGLNKIRKLAFIIFKHYKMQLITVSFSVFAVIFGLVVTFYLSTSIMAGIYNAMHSK